MVAASHVGRMPPFSVTSALSLVLKRKDSTGGTLSLSDQLVLCSPFLSKENVPYYIKCFIYLDSQHFVLIYQRIENSGSRT